MFTSRRSPAAKSVTSQRTVFTTLRTTPCLRPMDATSHSRQPSRRRRALRRRGASTRSPRSGRPRFVTRSAIPLIATSTLKRRGLPPRRRRDRVEAAAAPQGRRRPPRCVSIGPVSHAARASCLFRETSPGVSRRRPKGIPLRSASRVRPRAAAAAARRRTQRRGCMSSTSRARS